MKCVRLGEVTRAARVAFERRGRAVELFDALRLRHDGGLQLRVDNARQLDGILHLSLRASAGGGSTNINIPAVIFIEMTV